MFVYELTQITHSGIFGHVPLSLEWSSFVLLIDDVSKPDAIHGCLFIYLCFINICCNRHARSNKYWYIYLTSYFMHRLCYSLPAQKSSLLCKIFFEIKDAI